MGKHRKPNKIQKHLAVAVPVMTLCACLLASSPPTVTQPTAEVLRARPVVPTHSLVVHQDTPMAMYIADEHMAVTARMSMMLPPHITGHYHVKHHHVTFNQKVLWAAESQLGVPYVWGGETPGVAFDCSGLVQYAYGVAGHWVPRVANDQFNFFKMIPKSEARPGDLVFFHDNSDPSSYVYHVGIYLGHDDMMVVAPDAGSDVQYQNFDWSGDTATFGTLDIFR